MNPTIQQLYLDFLKAKMVLFREGNGLYYGLENSRKFVGRIERKTTSLHIGIIGANKLLLRYTTI